MHVRGYKEKGNINTPLELAMLNETSRFNLVIDIIDRVPKLRDSAAHLKEEMKNAIVENMAYAHEHGTDRKEITEWVWPYSSNRGDFAPRTPRHAPRAASPARSDRVGALAAGRSRIPVSRVAVCRYVLMP